MNNRQIVEIAALVSAYSPHIVTGNQPLPAGALEKFWDRSQRRLRLWLSSLTHYQRRVARANPAEHLQLWHDIEPILEEIFVSEVLTRVWGAALSAMDQERGTHLTEPVARNVLIGQLDARKRALQLLVTDTSLTLDDLRPIDTVRRRVERWTDLLLGHLVERYQVDDFAFDPQRAREFGAQQLLQTQERSREQVWILLLIGLRSSFSTTPLGPPTEVIQEELISSILACFPESAFHLEGPFRPIIASRIRSMSAATTHEKSPLTAVVRHPEVSFRNLRNRLPPR